MHSYYWKDMSITFYPCLNILDFSVCYADLSYICLQYTAHEFYFQSSAMALGSNGHMQMRSFCVLPNSFFGLYVIDRISSFPLMISIGMAAVARSEVHSAFTVFFFFVPFSAHCNFCKFQVDHIPNWAYSIFHVSKMVNVATPTHAKKSTTIGSYNSLQIMYMCELNYFVKIFHFFQRKIVHRDSRRRGGGGALTAAALATQPSSRAHMWSW